MKKDGKLLIWIYGKEGNEKLLMLLKPIRFFTTKLPYFLVAWIGKLLTLALYLILKILPTKSEYWNRAKKMEFWHLEQILIDQLIPKIAIYYSKAELKNLYKNLKYSDLQIKHTNQNSWSILITKIDNIRVDKMVSSYLKNKGVSSSILTLAMVFPISSFF